MRLTNIEIKNFRGIQHASVLFPQDSNIVCLIGPGDSGKTTLLNAIEWALWPSWNLVIKDTDFYNCDVSRPIEITASIAEPPGGLLKENKFGLYIRDLKKAISESSDDDEPTDDGTVILTIRLLVDSSLEPRWEIIKNHHEPKQITSNDRRLFSFGLVGNNQDRDFQWGRNSVLQKYGNSREALHDAFTKAIRAATETVQLSSLDEMTERMADIGKEYGVGFQGNLHNGFLMQNGAYSTAVGIFDDKVPFNQRGLGSRRLLSIGMNVHAYPDGALVLVDEVETGLEPYRIATLINQLRKQFQISGQVIMTTHSRSVVCECGIRELCIINSHKGELRLFSLSNEEQDHKNSMQGMIRRTPDAFLCKRIIVCEGKTEIGVIRAFESYLYKKKKVRFAYFGTGYALGEGGSRTLNFAKTMKKCGYEVCILMDSDVAGEEKRKNDAEKNGIPVFSWQQGFAIEEQIFHDFSVETLEKLVEYTATEVKSFAHVKAKLEERFKESRPYEISGQPSRIHLKPGMNAEEKTALGTLAKECEWYKRIDHGQHMGNIIFKEYDLLGQCGFKQTFDALLEWVTSYER